MLVNMRSNSKEVKARAQQAWAVSSLRQFYVFLEPVLVGDQKHMFFAEGRYIIHGDDD